jgi:hypothetical protein
MILPYDMLTNLYQMRVFGAVVSVPVDDLDVNDASVTAFPNTARPSELSHLDRFLGTSVVAIGFICPPERGGF